MNIVESFSCNNHRMVIEEIQRQQGHVVELRDRVLPMLPAGDGNSRLVIVRLLEEILRCSTRAISTLEIGGGNGRPDELAGEETRGGACAEKKRSMEEQAKHTGNKRRKNVSHVGSLATATPDYDGYQWRKYGQKRISKAKYSRSYYRCIDNKGQGCPATKTVQQADTGGGSRGEKLYNVDYYGDHTCCKNVDDDVARPPHIVEAAPRSQCGSPMLADESSHGQAMDSLFMVSDVAELLEVDVNVDVPLGYDHWAMGDWIGYEQESPMFIWGDLSEAMD